MLPKARIIASAKARSICLTRNSGPGCRPRMMKAPSISAIEALPGMPSAKRRHQRAALLGVAGAFRRDHALDPAGAECFRIGRRLLGRRHRRRMARSTPPTPGMMPITAADRGGAEEHAEMLKHREPAAHHLAQRDRLHGLVACVNGLAAGHQRTDFRHRKQPQRKRHQTETVEHVIDSEPETRDAIGRRIAEQRHEDAERAGDQALARAARRPARR